MRRPGGGGAKAPASAAALRGGFSAQSAAPATASSGRSQCTSPPSPAASECLPHVTGVNGGGAAHSRSRSPARKSEVGAPASQSKSASPSSLSVNQQHGEKNSSSSSLGLLLRLPVSKGAQATTTTGTATGSHTGKGKLALPSKGSNATGKGKRAGKQISTARINDSYAVSLPNALPLKQVIWAKESITGTWRLCSIVHARVRTAQLPSESFPVSAFLAASRCPTPQPTDASVCSTPQQKKESSSSSSRGRSPARGGFSCRGQSAPESAAQRGPDDYDYYVHFLGFDRRLDQWKSWEAIREDEADLPSDEPVVKEVVEPSDDEHAGMDEEYLREHEEATKVKSIHRIRMGRYSVDTWYFSPYPKQYQNVHTLHICEFCLAFFREETELERHMRFCECRHPPGNEIYRDNDIAVFEVDGSHCRVYCENLCFLSKLFLDHKTLRHPVSLFLFYVMTEIDEKGYHITGYFSKEKYSKNNVSCILTLPQHQRKGYGKFLINFSYLLSRAEKKAGTPERPLSDLGKALYMAFWTEVIVGTILRKEGRVSVQELSELTCIETADIVACLEYNGVLKNKGDCFFLLLPQQKVQMLKEASGRPSRPVKAEELHWVPYDRCLMPFECNMQT